ncbi:MAG: hypothetical protein MUQ65_13190 [Armatimonadetes bacterium]|nr:hypothetical protein [Armatimonadota bacterium]
MTLGGSQLMRVATAQRVWWTAVLMAMGLAFVGGLPAIAAPIFEGDEIPVASSAAVDDGDMSPAIENRDEAEEEALADREEDEAKWEVQVGTYLPALSTKLQAEARVGEEILGGTVDFEEDVGLEDRKTAYRLDGTYRLSRKGAIDFSYYRFDRSGRAVLARDIEFKDVVFPAGEGVVSNSGTRFYILRYSRLLHESEKSAVRGSIGVHYMRFSTDIATTGGTPLAESASVSAPLPTIGIKGTYELSPQWRLGWEVVGLAIDIGDYSGSWLDAGATVEYFLREDLAIGLGLSSFKVDVDADTSKLLGRLEYREVGPRIFGTARF